MRKSKKQMIALMLVMGMAVVGSMTGYTELAVESSDAMMNGTRVTNDGRDSVSELIGQIDATSLNVTLPLRVGFSIDPTIYTGSNITTQVGEKQSRRYRIINNSAIPVYVYISAVGVNKDKDDNPYTGGVADMSLVTTKEGLATAHSTMLAMKDITIGAAGAKPDTDDTGFWLGEKATADNYEHMLNSDKGKIGVKPGVNKTVMNLKVYRLIQAGWSHQGKSAATPTFTVTTTTP